MSTRGFFIGQILDDLDAISSQVKQRCQLGQTDLNVILENFFRDILNLIHGAALVNLNQSRSNEPGLDLGDQTSTHKRAFQVTSQANASKIKKTLNTITDEQLKVYDEFFVLIIGKRQDSYTLDPELTDRCKGFSDRNVLGISELCRDIINLEIDDIRAVHRKVTDEQRRIRVELEPLIDGSHQTTIQSMIEQVPDVTRSDATTFYGSDQSDLLNTIEEAQNGLNTLIKGLQNLPRLTREFYGWLIDISEENSMAGASGRFVNYDIVAGKHLDKIALNADIRLLKALNFLDLDRDDEWSSPYLMIKFPDQELSTFTDAFVWFLEEKKIKAENLFSTMNFSPFGPAPAS